MFSRWKYLFCLAALFFGAHSTSGSDFQGATHLFPIDEESINYGKSEANNPISQLQKRIESGEAKLQFDPRFGYLPSIVRELKLLVSSQMLVFSKTSMQRERISPRNPRSLFYNDDVYLGYIPGAPLMEISVADPKLGAVFYTVEQKENIRPVFKRTDQCLECHASSKSMGIPGHLVRSFETDEDGIVDLSTGISPINDRTPFEERWGGWYVSGTHGSQTHRGNLIGKPDLERHLKDPNFGGNLTNLLKFFDSEKYLSPNSDIVALMVLEHQTHMHNYITRLNYEGTAMLKAYGHVNYLKSAIEGFVKYMLFAEATPLRAKVKGTSTFQSDFQKLGPKDDKGRSLRDFDLDTRLFRYPCSFLIYSDSFNALPQPVKEKIYARLFEILSGKVTSPTYEYLTAEMRTAILEILRQTKSDLPEYFRDVTEENVNR
jgi:hypothetical protein